MDLDGVFAVMGLFCTSLNSFLQVIIVLYLSVKSYDTFVDLNSGLQTFLSLELDMYMHM